MQRQVSREAAAVNGRHAARRVRMIRDDPPARRSLAGASGEVPVIPVCVSGVSVTTAEWVSRVGELHTHAGIQCFPAG